MAKKKKGKGRKSETTQTLAEKLAASQKKWRKSEARTFGAPLPDGEYEGRIENAVIEESKQGRLQTVWTLKVTDGPCENREIRKYSGLESEENMDWFKGDLETIELDVPNDLADLGETLEEAVGFPIRFQVRSRDEFTNVDFIERLEPSEDGENDEEEAEEEEYTLAEIKKMKKAELKEVAESCDLDPDDYDSTKELRDGVIEELELE